MLATLKHLLGIRLKATLDPQCAPGEHVYHEYFVSADPAPEGYLWLGRVYRGGSLMLTQTGASKTRHAARAVALAWAEKAKVEVRATFDTKGAL